MKFFTKIYNSIKKSVFFNITWKIMNILLSFIWCYIAWECYNKYCIDGVIACIIVFFFSITKSITYAFDGEFVVVDKKTGKKW